MTKKGCSTKEAQGSQFQPRAVVPPKGQPAPAVNGDAIGQGATRLH